jgi:hypothetical protein
MCSATLEKLRTRIQEEIQVIPQRLLWHVVDDFAAWFIEGITVVEDYLLHPA